jgi:hypothetical protein
MSIADAKAAKQRLVELPSRAHRALQEYRSLRLDLAGRWDFHGERKREVEQQLRGQAEAVKSRLQGEYREAAEAFRAAVHSARRAALPMGPAEQLAWEALRTRLDSTRATQGRDASLVAVAQARLREAQLAGDQPMLRVARQMLPDYLAADPTEGMPPELVDWLDLVAGDASIREAVALDGQGKRGIDWIEAGLNAVAFELDGRDEAVALPNWDGSVIEVDPPPDYGAAERAAVGDAAHVLAAAGYRPVAGGGVAPDGRSRSAAGERLGGAGVTQGYRKRAIPGEHQAARPSPSLGIWRA